MVWTFASSRRMLRCPGSHEPHCPVTDQENIAVHALQMPSATETALLSIHAGILLR